MNHPLSDLPTGLRIDISLAVLSAMSWQEASGWTYEALAEICGCSKSAIQQREASALKKARFRLKSIYKEFNQ